MGTLGSRWRGLGAVALVSAVIAVASPASAQAPPDEVGTVRVVHGLRGAVADVYLDGTLALPTFQPERATEPMQIPAGDHVVEIRTAGAAVTDTPLLTQTVTVPAGFVGSLVAHLAADGEPALTAFADDLTAVPAGQARVVVRHTAAAGDVAVRLDDETLVASLAPGTEASDVVDAGTRMLAVMPAAGGEPSAPPEEVTFGEGTATFMYLIGSEADGTLGWAAVPVGDLETPPAMIQTGDGSMLRDESGPNPYAIGAVLAALVAAIAATFVVRIRRPTASR